MTKHLTCLKSLRFQVIIDVCLSVFPGSSAICCFWIVLWWENHRCTQLYPLNSIMVERKYEQKSNAEIMYSRILLIHCRYEQFKFSHVNISSFAWLAQVNISPSKAKSARGFACCDCSYTMFIFRAVHSITRVRLFRITPLA